MNQDPKDKSNRKVKYRDYGGDKENLQQDWIYMAKELQAAMASPEKAAAFRRAAAQGNGMGQRKKDLEIERRRNDVLCHRSINLMTV